MPANELVVVHANHAIQVVKTPTGGARLYVDGELIDTTNDLYASEQGPALVGVVDEMLVEAFAMPSEILVRVAGKRVTGDQAYAAAD